MLEVVLQLKAEREQQEQKQVSFRETISNPNSSRRIVIITSDEQLNEMLEQPLDRWRIFLHPTQKELVEKHYNGPVRVLGGAGTGKKVVAMHRARHLVRHILKPGEKVLFTTFTTNLALTIESILKTMCLPEELERISVVSIDKLASRILVREGNKYFTVKQPTDPEIREIWNEALEKYGWKEEDLPFLKSEYKNVVQQHGIETWEEYLNTLRVGRKIRITRQERKTGIRFPISVRKWRKTSISSMWICSGRRGNGWKPIREWFPIVRPLSTKPRTSIRKRSSWCGLWCRKRIMTCLLSVMRINGSIRAGLS